MILASYMSQRKQGTDAATGRTGREVAPDAESTSETKLLLSVLIVVADVCGCGVGTRMSQRRHLLHLIHQDVIRGLYWRLKGQRRGHSMTS